MAVGQRRYIETTLEAYRDESKNLHSAASTLKMKISTTLITGALSTPLGAVCYLLCLERLK